MDMNGKVLWKTMRAPLFDKGGTSNDDPMASRIGGTTQNWAPIALAGGKLLVRDQSRLMCIRVGK
jgi:hypothetical protein